LPQVRRQTSLQPGYHGRFSGEQEVAIGGGRHQPIQRLDLFLNGLFRLLSPMSLILLSAPLPAYAIGRHGMLGPDLPGNSSQIDFQDSGLFLIHQNHDVPVIRVL
jgi:hypothetical protein